MFSAPDRARTHLQFFEAPWRGCHGKAPSASTIETVSCGHVACRTSRQMRLPAVVLVAAHFVASGFAQPACSVAPGPPPPASERSEALALGLSLGVPVLGFLVAKGGEDGAFAVGLGGMVLGPTAAQWYGG